MTPTQTAVHWSARLQRLRTRPWLKIALEMCMSRGLSALLGGVAMIWVSRCLGPQNLGISGAVQNFAVQLQMLILLNQDTGLVRSYKHTKDEAEREQLISGVITFRLLVLGALLVAAAFVLLAVWPAPEWRRAWWYFFPLLAGLACPATWLYHAQGRQHLDMRWTTIAAGLSLCGYVILLRPGAQAGDNLAVLAAAQIMVVAVSWHFALAGRHRFRLSLRAVRGYLPTLWLGRWLAVAGGVSVVYMYLQTPLIAALQTEAKAGLYRSAEQAVGAIAPFFTIVAALLFPRFIEWAKLGQAELWRRQNMLLKFFTVLVIPLAGAGALIAPWLFPFLLGAEFGGAALPFSILLVAKCINLLSGLFTWALYAQHRDKAMLAILTLVAAVNLALNLWLIPSFGGLGAAWASVICELILFAGSYALCRHAVRNN